jgi:hypothetical protein
VNSTLSRPEITDLRKTADRFATIADEMPAKIAKERVNVFEAAEQRISHAGNEARGVANWIALLVAGLIVLTFVLAIVYRRMAAREAKPMAAPAAAKPRQPVND